MNEIRAHLEEWERSGGIGVVYVERANEVLAHEALGPVEPETGFDVGSLTKLFTAAAILELVADRRLSLGDPLARLLGDAPADKTSITIEQLLKHEAGLADLVGPRGVPLEEYSVEFDYELVSRDELVRRALASPLRSPPGSERTYSNLGYGLLGVVIELASGRPYEEYVRETVLPPAEMERTGYAAPAWQRDELAIGYRDDRAWGTPLDHPWLDDGPSWNLRAAGGMLSTASELARWPATVADNTQLLALHMRESRRGTRVLGHAGSNGIFYGVLIWDLDERLVVSALTSVAERPATALARELVGIALGLAA